MSEIRKDPASPTWVIVATERSKRPFGSPPRTANEQAARCPLCEEIAVLRADTRELNERKAAYVLGNKYPAVRVTTDLFQGAQDDFYHYIGGFGSHEIVVETSVHDDTLASMSPLQIEAVLRVYIERFRHWRRDPRIAYILVFRNHRPAAGASLAHPHSQIISVPMIPHRVTEELQEALRFHDQNGRCVYCETIAVEEKSGARTVFVGDTMFVHTPYASRFPFEMRITPRRHRADFEDTSDEEISELARILSDLTRRLERLLNDPPFNLLLHVAPVRTSGLVYYHWHIEIIPRLTLPAGFEWATGVYINPLNPEEAARQLKEALKVSGG